MYTSLCIILISHMSWPPAVWYWIFGSSNVILVMVYLLTTSFLTSPAFVVISYCESKSSISLILTKIKKIFLVCKKLIWISLLWQILVKCVCYLEFNYMFKTTSIPNTWTMKYVFDMQLLSSRAGYAPLCLSSFYEAVLTLGM